MADLTLEQQKALALSRSRQRQAAGEAEGGDTAPPVQQPPEQQLLPGGDPREAVATIGSGLVGQAVGGLAGIAGLVGGLAPGGESPSEKANRFLEVTRDAITIDPISERGAAVQTGFETLVEEATKKLVREPIAGATGIAQLAAGQDIEDVRGTVGRVIEEGVGPTAGGAALDLTGSPAVASALETAITGAPLLFGLRRPTTTRDPSKPTPRQEVAATAAEEGYVTTPSVRGEGGVAGLAEGVGGKLKTGQQAMEINQAVTNKLANRAVGLPEGTPLSVDTLQGIRAQAGKAYEAVRDVGQIFTDTVFRRDLAAATSKFRSASKDFPALAQTEILEIVDSLRVAEFGAGGGIDAIGLLRNRADVAFRGGDKALGNSYRAAADAIEGVIERHLGRGGDPALVEGFRQARQQIAETYSVEEALRAGNMEVGNVNATNLSAQLKKGRPLTGDLRAIAEFANTFPALARLSQGVTQAFSPLDAFAAGATGIGGAAAIPALGPAALIPAAIQLSRPLLRKGALSNVAREAGLSSGASTPSAGAVLGGTTGAILSQEEQE